MSWPRSGRRSARQCESLTSQSTLKDIEKAFDADSAIESYQFLSGGRKYTARLYRVETGTREVTGRSNPDGGNQIILQYRLPEYSTYVTAIDSNSGKLQLWGFLDHVRGQAHGNETLFRDLLAKSKRVACDGDSGCKSGETCGPREGGGTQNAGRQNSGALPGWGELRSLNSDPGSEQPFLMNSCRCGLFTYEE
jgi:hypothetical protein